MTRFYITEPNAPNGFVELTEEEWLALIGDDTTRPYAYQVYRGEIAIVDVPEDIREAVQDIVDNKIARWGLYSERDIPSDEVLDILMGGADDEA